MLMKELRFTTKCKGESLGCSGKRMWYLTQCSLKCICSLDILLIVYRVLWTRRVSYDSTAGVSVRGDFMLISDW